LQDVGGSDRVSLVLFGTSAELRLRSSADVTRVLADIDATQPGAGGTRYAPALKVAASVLAESALPRKEVLLVSDFQRVGWQPDEALRLPAGSVLTPIPVEPGATRNLSMTPVALQRARADNQERLTVTAGVANRGDEPASVTVDLEVDGRVVQSNPVTVEAASSASVVFQPITMTDAPLRIATRIPDDGLAVDNAF